MKEATLLKGRRQASKRHPDVGRVRSQPALRTHQARSGLFEALLEHLPHMIFLKDARDLRFVHFNRAGEELLGRDRADVLGKNDYDLFPRDEADFFTATDREVLRSGRLLDIPEEPIHTRHGGIRLLHTKKIPICDAAGRRRYLLGISEDVTDRRKAEQGLWRTKMELEQRVSGRTSELRAVNAALQREIVGREAASRELRDVSARLIHAQEEERRRIARELHDDFSQQLAIMAIEVESLGRQLPASAVPLKIQATALWGKVRQLSHDVHSLSHELHPSKLEHLGLCAALRALCRDTSERHGIPVRFADRAIPESCPEAVGLSLYRIAQEALHNVVKHSRAREARVKLFCAGGRLTLCVTDNGRGFDERRHDEGLGLVSMRERARGIGGHVQISSRLTVGTRVKATVPAGLLK